MKKAMLGILSGAAGAGLVLAAFQLAFLHWVVDGPGWLVSRFTSVNFHEGEGAFGFFLAIVLSWVVWSVGIFLLAIFVQSKVRRPLNETLRNADDK